MTNSTYGYKIVLVFCYMFSLGVSQTLMSEISTANTFS